MLCLFALSMVLSAWALPPDEKKVTLDLKDVPMETFLNTVKQKAGINMLYNSQMFKGVEPVTVKATNEPWRELLDRVLSPKGFLCYQRWYCGHQEERSEDTYVGR